MSTKFTAYINVPGYLPYSPDIISDEPLVFDSVQEAWNWLCEERTQHEDEEADEAVEGYTETRETLAILGEEAQTEYHPQFWRDLGLGPDGTGTVYGATPGGRIYDLGLAYSVIEYREEA